MLQTMGDTRDTLRMLGTDWGNPNAIDGVGWAWFSVPLLGSLSVGKLFFAWRISIIANRSHTPAVIAVITAVQFNGAGICTGVDIARAERFSLLIFRLLRPPVVWLSAIALADLIIVAAMAYSGI